MPLDSLPTVLFLKDCTLASVFPDEGLVLLGKPEEVRTIQNKVRSEEEKVRKEKVREEKVRKKRDVVRPAEAVYENRIAWLCGDPSK